MTTLRLAWRSFVALLDVPRSTAVDDYWRTVRALSSPEWWRATTPTIGDSR